jgi:hypothetical protein
MKFNPNLSVNLHNLIFFAGFDSEDNIDTYGVGAMMPQDMADFTFLDDTRSYRV